MFIDRGLQVGVLPEGANIEPFAHRRQGRNVARHDGRRGLKGMLLVPGDDAGFAAIRTNFQTSSKVINHVELAGCIELLAAGDEIRDLRAGGVFQRDLMLEVPGIAELDAGPGNVIEPQIAAVNLVGLAFGDFNGHGHVAEVAADQGEPDILRADTGDGLVLQDGVHQQELPVRACARGEDAVLAAGDVHIAGLVADVFHRRQRRADLEVHVTQIAVLCDMETDADGTGVAFTDLEVDVAHRAVETELAGINNRPVGLAPLGELDHVPAGSKRPPPAGLLKTGGIVAQHKDRAVLAVADHAGAGRNVHGLAQAIAPFRDEHDAAAGTVHGLLDAVRIVSNSVTLDLELLGTEDDGTGVIGALREDRLRTQRSSADSDHQQDDDAGPRDPIPVFHEALLRL